MVILRIRSIILILLTILLLIGIYIQSTKRYHFEPPTFSYAVSGKEDDSYLSEDEKINIRVYGIASPGVVNITTTIFVRDFFSIYPQKGAGSGSIIDERGFILTNYHVIEGAAELDVVLADGSHHRAKVIGTDPENDLAVIKINPGNKKLTIIKMGDSTRLKVGQKVLAIGNPFGLDRTLTTGVISAVGRPLTTEEGKLIENVIQTDASINPGNSGGPLLNTKGEMIGINTAIFSPSGGSVGIGFAIPVEIAKGIVPDLIAYGKVKRPWVGVVTIPIWPKLAEALRLPVSDLGGDIITKIDDKPVRSMEELSAILKNKKIGDKIKITILRGKTLQELEIILKERP